ncbi:MAG TPA: tRNA (adenosine(37)-N6)-dimethylallyltransferase MiaA [Bacteroides sp.]|nr:tRNA (adenosine(37)-N6)-dimethylallyltransferase MiaA [Bacteroides sp.]
MEQRKPDLVTVLGHTAAGKTRFAAILAHRLGGEIISADSRQVYRGMDLGTGKDYGDYLVDGERVHFHLIDIADAGEEYNVYRFMLDFKEAYGQIRKKGRVPVMCGGTGLYLESVLRNYRLVGVPVNKALREELEGKDMKTLREILAAHGPLHNITDTGSRKRLIRAIEIAEYQHDRAGISGTDDLPSPSASLVLGIRYDRENRRRRITQRLDERLAGGMVEEVQGLLERGIPPERMEYYGLEYRIITRYLRKELTFEEMHMKLNTAIHRFAKRQMTYFRGMEKRGIVIHWLEGEMTEQEKIEKAMALCSVT